MDLFRRAMGADWRTISKDNHNDPEGEGGDGDEDEEGVRWGREGGVDCELLVAGSYLHAHRVILARRSPVLRDMIAQVPSVTFPEGCNVQSTNLRIIVSQCLGKHQQPGHRRVILHMMCRLATVTAAAPAAAATEGTGMQDRLGYVLYKIRHQEALRGLIMSSSASTRLKEPGGDNVTPPLPSLHKRWVPI